MRGAIALPIPVPRSGWFTSLPIHEIPADALFDGLNMAIEPDGLLHVRKGMERLIGPSGTTIGALDGRVSAGLGFVDNTGSAQVVVSTLAKQYVLIGGVFTDISNVPPTTGDEDTPYRLVAFAQAPNDGSRVYLLDGAAHDNVMTWAVGTASFVTVTNTNFNAAALTQMAATDMAVVADRLVFVDTFEQGGDAPGRHTQRVRWSAVYDGTNWPIGAWNDLAGIGNLIAIRQSSRTTAVIYGESGAYVMAGVPGDDAGAFVFDRINDVVVAPCCPTGIVEVAGRHWFLAPDNNFWVCDGTNAQIASDSIHQGLINNLSPGSTLTKDSDSNQRPVAVYDQINERVIIFVTFQGDDDPFNAVCWNQRIQAWEPPWRFPEAITAAFNVIEMLGPTWQSTPATLNGKPLEWNPPPAQGSNASELYPTWNDIPEQAGPALWVGTADGFVNRFYSTQVDAPVQAIPYFAQWGLRSATNLSPEGLTLRLEVNMVEALLVPIDGDDQIRLTLSGLSTPYDPAPTPLLNALIDENDITTWIRRLDPTVAVSAFRPANYMQFVLSGSSADSGPIFAGLTLYAFPSKRGDPLVGIAANTTTP